VPTQISALEKHECPACGAQAEWNASKQKLLCPFCGTESPYQFDRQTGKVVELDLVTALRELPEDQRGWQTDRRSVQCQSCRAVMVFDPARVGQNCEFCGSPALVPYEEIKSPIRRRAFSPFRVDANRVRDDIRRWWRSKWLAPGRLAARSLSTRFAASTFPTGHSTRRCIARGRPKRLPLLRQCARPRRARTYGDAS
jgi:predicted RNA-binding Zn-ribbon protein involved in translation (DUF1610 family)